MPDPDALELLDMIANDPSLDRVVALPPSRFASKEARDKLRDRVRAERAAWEVKRGDRQGTNTNDTDNDDEA